MQRVLVSHSRPFAGPLQAPLYRRRVAPALLARPFHRAAFLRADDKKEKEDEVAAVESMEEKEIQQWQAELALRERQEKDLLKSECEAPPARFDPP